MRYLFFVLIITYLCSCSHEQIYDSMKNAKRMDCETLPWSQREECLKNLAPDYKEYECERKKLHAK